MVVIVVVLDTVVVTLAGAVLLGLRPPVVVLVVVVVVVARVLKRVVVEAPLHLTRLPETMQVWKSLSVQSRHAHALHFWNCCLRRDIFGDAQQSPSSQEQKALLLKSSQTPVDIWETNIYSFACLSGCLSVCLPACLEYVHR